MPRGKHVPNSPTKGATPVFKDPMELLSRATWGADIEDEVLVIAHGAFMEMREVDRFENEHGPDLLDEGQLRMRTDLFLRYGEVFCRWIADRHHVAFDGVAAVLKRIDERGVVCPEHLANPRMIQLWDVIVPGESLTIKELRSLASKSGVVGIDDKTLRKYAKDLGAHVVSSNRRRAEKVGK